MIADEITLEIRNGDFEREGQIDLGLITGGKFIKRANAVGAWQFSLPNEHPACAALKVPKSGIVLWINNQIYLSGPMLNWTKVESSDDPIGKTTFVGADDMIVLSDKRAYPVPSSGDVTNGQTSAANDVRTGPAETIMKAYVTANVGIGAPANRQDDLSRALRIEPDQGRGIQVTGSPRFDQVGALLSDLAAIDGTLSFDVVQETVRLGTLMTVFARRDRSDLVRMDVLNDLLDSASSGVAAPSLTHEIVAGQGEGTARQFYEVTDDLAQQASDLWGRRIEAFADQRQTDDVDQLQQAGLKDVQAGGRTVVSLKVTPADGDVMRYGIDWATNDLVGIVLDEQVLVDVVSEAIIVVEAGDARIGATIGDPVGYDWEAAVSAGLRDHDSRLSRLERST